MIDFVVATALTASLVEVIKQTTKLNKDYLPALAVVVGIILMLIFGADGLKINLFTGLVAGLSASGAYDNLEKILNEKRKN